MADPSTMQGAVESDFYIPARTSLDPNATTRLKHGDTFAVFDASGDLLGFPGNSDGIYHKDTRHLSHYELRLQGARPMLLASAIQSDNAALAVDLTNPDFLDNGQMVLARDTLHIHRLRFAWNGTLYEKIVVHNYDRQPRLARLSLTFGADFADLFEARGQKRSQRGVQAEPLVQDASVTFRYRGLDGVDRRTRLSFWPMPEALDQSSASMIVTIPADGQHTILVAVFCDPPAEAAAFDGAEFMTAMIASRRSLAKSLRRAPRVTGGSESFNELWERSRTDLAMLVTDTPFGPYPYAGIPWFSTVFGRDALISSLFALWLDPEIARGVLGFLAEHRARHTDAFQDAEPGKILHEVRQGEMAAMREIPFGFYYGSIDSTPLFVLVAGEYLKRTGDVDFARQLWPAVKDALDWMDRSGDRDGDGFLEYARQSDTGLQNQGWKDSHDSISHEDGSLAEGPIALCEVQAYAYGAWRAGAAIARLTGVDGAPYEAKAEALRAAFDGAFWLDDLGTYALALDGRKQPCRVSSSNAGHVLLTGLARPERAERLAQTLLGPQLYSGWGIRTLATTEARYNPMSYHNGSVWPHDNAVIALGLARYGLTSGAARIFGGLAAAAAYLPLMRLPELFCGFTQRRRAGPVAYPVACAPQAWAAATPIALVAAMLGLEIDGSAERVTVGRPTIPPSIGSITIEGLRVGERHYRVEALQSRADIRPVGDSWREARAASG